MKVNNILQSPRLRIRLLERPDLPLRVAWLNEPEIQATLNFDFPTSLARTEQWFNNVLLDASRRDLVFVDLESENTVAFGGLIGIDPLPRKAELYIFLGRAFWGRGLGTETYQLAVNYGFHELGLNKIYGYQLASNVGAHRIVEKLGWKRDGLLRQDLFAHGGLRDRYIVSILREDWEKLEFYWFAGDP